MAPMPEPDDLYGSAFVAEYMKCWRMIHDRQGQATNCLETPTWTGRCSARLAVGGGECGRVLSTSRG